MTAAGQPPDRSAVVRVAAGSSLAATTVLIAIDDTDNLESRGTGHLAKQLVAELTEAGLGSALGVTRHQLLVDPRIPYTSHNSDACIAWDGGMRPDVGAIVAFAGDFLERRSAPGSDPGLAVASALTWADAGTRAALIEFGRRAKVEVLDQPQARELASSRRVHLSGHGGTNDGIIGALAGIGLHLSGADGFFLWMPGIRELVGELTYGDLLSAVPIDGARDPDGRVPQLADMIEMGDWVRPILTEGRAVLLLRDDAPSSDGGPETLTSTNWKVAPRAVVKSY